MAPSQDLRSGGRLSKAEYQYTLSDFSLDELTLWHDKVYVGTQDGRLLALHARNGKLAWSVQTLDPGNGAFISGAPPPMPCRLPSICMRSATISVVYLSWPSLSCHLRVCRRPST